MTNLLAQNSTNLGNLNGIGPLANFDSAGSAISLFSKVMSIIVGFMTTVAGIYFIFQFIIGAIGWISAGGDKAKVQAATAKITQSIIGLVIVIAAIFLIDLIGSLLGIEILSPGKFIINIWI